MTDFENEYIKGKTLEELVDDMGRPVALPGTPTGEMIRAAIQAKIAERLAAPRRWAMVAAIAAAISAATAVVTAIVGF